MHFRRLALILIVLVLVGEAAVTIWRFLPIPSATAPVFSLPPATERFENPGGLDSVIEAYGADRGAEWLTIAPDGTRLALFCFEWDQVQAEPVMALAGHSPDECNVAAGYTLQGILTPRIYDVPGQPPLVFDATHFTDPAGRSVHMFKLAWIQGLGSKDLRIGTKRLLRVKNSFQRHAGAARVVQAGVFDAHNADHAWQIFRTQVLDHLEWK